MGTTLQLVETATAAGQDNSSPHQFPEQKYSAFGPPAPEPANEVDISIDGNSVLAMEGELLVEAVLREKEIPHICYHSPLMGPIQTCDTCMVEVDGKLVRSCGTKVSSGMRVVTDSKRAQDARAEAFDTILGNHMLYCTVCDNNNENCRVHNTAMALSVQHQEHPDLRPEPLRIGSYIAQRRRRSLEQGVVQHGRIR